MSGPAAPRVVVKWRPPLALVVAAVLTLVASLPIGAILLFRVWDNQLVREAEAELAAESAALAAAIAADLARERPAGLVLGPPVIPPPAIGDGLTPLRPHLDLAADPILPSRPDARPAEVAPSGDVLAFGARLTPQLRATQALTLAGFRVLDARGVVIAGRDEIGLSLAHVEEVAAALDGRVGASLRERVSKHPVPPLASLSRGGRVRVFLAVPVAVEGRVAAVVLASRTSADLRETLYRERHALGLVLLFAVTTVATVGFLFQRTITRPVRDLIDRTRRLAGGDRTALRPLAHHGTAEFASLSQSLLDMAAGLAARSDYVSTFAAHVAHELKSPLTAIAGAAELLADDVAEPSMTSEQRAAFLRRIGENAERLGALVSRLRDLARAETTPTIGEARPDAVIAVLRAEGHAVSIAAEGVLDRPLALAADTLRIVLGHLLDNADRHGATTVTITGAIEDGYARLRVADDGSGVSPANRARIFDPFFTTRRAEGGTGMGLPIVRALVEAHRGTIDLVDGDRGATFEIVLPLATEAFSGGWTGR